MKKSMLFAMTLMGSGSLFAFKTQIILSAKTEGADELKQPVTIKIFVREGMLGLFRENENNLYKTIVLEPGIKASVTLEEGTYTFKVFNTEGKMLADQGDLVGRYVYVSPAKKAGTNGWVFTVNKALLNAPTYHVTVGEEEVGGLFGKKRIITFTSQDKIAMWANALFTSPHA